MPQTAANPNSLAAVDQRLEGELDRELEEAIDGIAAKLDDPEENIVKRGEEGVGYEEGYQGGYGREQRWLEDHQAEIRALVKDYEQRYDGEIDEVRIEDLGRNIYNTRWGQIEAEKKGQAFIKGADRFGREQWTPNVIGLDKETLMEEGLQASRKYFEEEAAHVVGQKKYAQEFDLSLYELKALQPLIEGQVDHFYNSEEDDREQSYILVPGDNERPVSPERKLYDAYLEGDLDLERYVQSLDPELADNVDVYKMEQFLAATQSELEEKMEQGMLPAYEHEIEPDDFSYEELEEVDLYLDGQKVDYTEAEATNEQLQDVIGSQARTGP